MDFVFCVDTAKQTLSCHCLLTSGPDNYVDWLVTLPAKAGLILVLGRSVGIAEKAELDGAVDEIGDSALCTGCLSDPVRGSCELAIERETRAGDEGVGAADVTAAGAGAWLGSLLTATGAGPCLLASTAPLAPRGAFTFRTLKSKAHRNASLVLV